MQTYLAEALLDGNVDGLRPCCDSPIEVTCHRSRGREVGFEARLRMAEERLSAHTLIRSS